MLGSKVSLLRLRTVPSSSSFCISFYRLSTKLVYSNLSISFSTSNTNNNNDSNDDDTNTPVSLARGGWYSPASIERRLSVKRKAPPIDKQGNYILRTKPGLSDEDIYLQAGAPGYDVDRSNPGM